MSNTIQTRPVRAYELRAGDTVNGVLVEAAEYGEDGVFFVDFGFMVVYGAETIFTGVVFA